MRLTVMSQTAKGLRSRDNPERAAEVAKELERLKWFLWHGNVFRALQTVEDLQIDLDNTEQPSIEQQKLLKMVTEFGGYIRVNGTWIPNYGERYRSGDAISSAFVESAVNQVVSKRMVKKQQMRWAPKSAHLLLQVRARVLNDEATSSQIHLAPSPRTTTGRNSAGEPPHGCHLTTSRAPRRAASVPNRRAKAGAASRAATWLQWLA
jgi:hypothetical protein